MVKTVHLQPPLTGLRSDPLLFGVAEALARLFPIEDVRLCLVPELREEMPPKEIEEPEPVA